MHSYAKSMSSSSFLLFVLSRNEVLYLAPLHLLGITNFLTEGKSLERYYYDITCFLLVLFGSVKYVSF